MFANSKFSRIGLVSVFAVLVAALGGCAESVDREPAGVPHEARTSLNWARVPPLVRQGDVAVPEKVDVKVAIRAPRGDLKQTVQKPRALYSSAH